MYSPSSFWDGELSTPIRDRGAEGVRNNWLYSKVSDPSQSIVPVLFAQPAQFQREVQEPVNKLVGNVPEGPVPVLWFPVKQVYLSTWNATNRSVKAVSSTSIHVPGVETLKIRVEWYKTLTKRRRGKINERHYLENNSRSLTLDGLILLKPLRYRWVSKLKASKKREGGWLMFPCFLQ